MCVPHVIGRQKGRQNVCVTCNRAAEYESYIIGRQNVCATCNRAAECIGYLWQYLSMDIFHSACSGVCGRCGDRVCMSHVIGWQSVHSAALYMWLIHSVTRDRVAEGVCHI